MLSNQLSNRYREGKFHLKSYIIKLCVRLGFLICALLNFSVRASVDGWYRVHEYKGKIGDFSVHLSFQDFSYFNGNTLVNGSYYYEKYYSPILLYGVFEEDDITLCKVKNKSQYDDFILDEKKPTLKDCEFKLKKDGDKLTGQWKSNGKSYSVELTYTNFLDNTQVHYVDYIEKGKMEIPFWGQTRKHGFIGIYETVNKKMEINEINVVDKKSGAVIQVINPQLNNCQLGFYMAPIYLHVATKNDTTIKLNCKGSIQAEKAHFYQDDKKKGKYIYIKDYYDKYYK